MGRVVLITGGGGPGMGSAISRRFALAGDTVVVSDLDAGRAEALAKELVADGHSAFGVGLDVRDPDACDRVVGEVIAAHGQLDVLCLHASGGGAGASAMTVTDEEMAQAFAGNVAGNTALLRAALEDMVPRKSGV